MGVGDPRHLQGKYTTSIFWYRPDEVCNTLNVHQGSRLCKNVGCDANTRRPYGLMFLFLGFDRLLRSCGLDIAVLMGQIIGYGAE